MPTIEMTAPAGAELDLFDLDLEVSVEQMSLTPAITSISLCTPGCTSAGGGSNCSFCC
ncbi:gallidermin/nisin family lantibiotic [Actinokineospora diospyrosa]|uniref:DisA n=1 Tax=Actinokineospora diospyrosa TaxID=103728 RepID=A0A8G1A4B2_9PSEU|nr:gallidermin/nisin family lantibiotic [Actinokineospora diospyrosa]MCP2271563.1 lantibiotic, gallidermin/nisin family [Actinokineospora diospyrosa]QYZ85378.1 DisA [Actinokineospora diospyrosa]